MEGKGSFLVLQGIDLVFFKDMNNAKWMPRCIRGIREYGYIDYLGPYTSYKYPDSKVHGANMGPIWGR